jgi:DNA-binding NarL/FixJ family response regulator
LDKPKDPIRIAIADDHPVVLAGVKALIEAEPNLQLVGEASDGIGALELVKQELPDIAVLDIAMPGISGIELADRLRTECPTVMVIILTIHEDIAYLQRLLQAGARGYLLKRSAAEDLPRAVQAVASGGLYLDPAIAEKAVRAGGPEKLGAVEPAELSTRETDVLRLTAQGFSNKEIGARLGISMKTVETYKARAAEKLDLRTRAEIVRYGASRGWLDGLDKC